MYLMAVLGFVTTLNGLSSPDAITLSRKFKVGTIEQYEVRASLSAEQKMRGLKTAIPEDLDLSYNFSVRVKSLGADGIAKLIYSRPTFTTVEGETFDAPPKTKVEKLNLKFELTVSPINEILSQTDLTAPKKESRIVSAHVNNHKRLRKFQDVIGQYVGEIERLSLSVGSFDSSLDFNPRLSIEDVKPGDTWKRTVGYSPQKLKGKDGKVAVQRLDYVFTYRGTMQSAGKMVSRVEATLNVDSDLGAFVNQNLGPDSEESGIKTIPLKLQSSIEFDLDPKNGSTLAARAKSAGGFSVILTDDPEDPAVSVSLKGKTFLRQVSRSAAK